jgi:hypothetical protein
MDPRFPFAAACNPRSYNSSHVNFILSKSRASPLDTKVCLSRRAQRCTSQYSARPPSWSEGRALQHCRRWELEAPNRASSMKITLKLGAVTAWAIQRKRSATPWALWLADLCVCGFKQSLRREDANICLSTVTDRPGGVLVQCTLGPAARERATMYRTSVGVARE